MTVSIERDALANTPEQPPPEAHQHSELKSFIATPRTDTNFINRIRSLFVSELKPGIHISQKDSDGLRYMFLITSNSYEDRENETLTSEALKAYEASCYIGEDLFHCDNPLLWFHDDDVPMGEIVAVNYSEPFLIEIAKELPTRVARVLWDFAEQNEDKAGASHRFGYREDDRTADGVIKRIYKQESTYLPERILAANIGTYSGVIKQMASAESDKRLNQIFEQATGIKDAAAKIHTKSGQLEKELAELGINHKALGQKADPPNPDMPMDDEEVADEEVKADGTANVGQLIELVAQIYQLVMGQVDSQEYLMENQLALGKAFKDLQDDNTKKKSLDEDVVTRLAAVEKQLKLQPRSVQQQKGSNPEAVIEATKNLMESVKNEGKEDVWGFKAAPPIDYTSVTGK